jgi:HD-like signal output (HDOD) protein/CheY-like chemotaxis protein
MTKILVVDDMPIFRDPIAASLRLAGFETVCASNGQEALAATKAHRPALVLLDVSMPVMDGLACLRAIRADPEIAKTPIILFTALSDKQHVMEARKLGVQEYLLKSSFSLKDLLVRVLKYTGKPEKPAALKAEQAPAPVSPTQPTAKPSSERPIAPAPAAPPAASPDALPRLLTREQCLARAEKALAAKTLSGAVAEVISLAASPRGSAADVAPLIARDPMLSARVLQAANSAAYVSARPVVSTIPDAVRQIGLATVRSIAAALGIFDAMPPSQADGFNPVRCWQHSFAVAMLCERLVPKDSGIADAGLCYLVGLCHDLGEILFHTHFGKEYAQVIELHQRTGRRVEDLERQMLGVTRGELVQTIIASVGLPEAIKEPIRSFHDGSGQASSAPTPLTRVLRIAEMYANGLVLASSGHSPVAPFTRAECRAALGREEPKPPDPTMFRSEVFYTTGVLARVSSDEAEGVMRPQYERTTARIFVVREAGLSSFDPVVAALETMAHVRVVDRPAAVEVNACDGVVVLSPSDLAPGLSGQVISELAAARGPGGRATRALWLVGRINGMTQRGAPVAPQRWPVRLDELAAFVQGCVAPGEVRGAAA